MAFLARPSASRKRFPETSKRQPLQGAPGGLGVATFADSIQRGLEGTRRPYPSGFSSSAALSNETEIHP